VVVLNGWKQKNISNIYVFLAKRLGFYLVKGCFRIKVILGDFISKVRTET
jgi:hypothetical protein